MKYLRRKLLKDVQLWYADNYKTLTEIEEQNKCKSILYICIDLRHNIERYSFSQIIIYRFYPIQLKSQRLFWNFTK